MKVTVKTLKGSHFEIRVHPADTVMAVKKNIEEKQGKDSYPCGQQLLIHNGKVLKDESTLAENKVTEDGFLVVMLSKSKTSGANGTSSAPHLSAAAPVSTPTPAPASSPAPAPVSSLAFVPASNPTSAPVVALQAIAPSGTYDEADSNLESGNSLEQTIQQLMDMGGGIWDKATVTRALQAAYNNPELAVDYLYTGIPETAEGVVPVLPFPENQEIIRDIPITGTEDPLVFGGPNSSPLNLFPQETLSDASGGIDGDGHGSLDFLRNSEQFQALRLMVQSNPQILQPMLRELGKQNPQLFRLIQEHNEEFLQLINEPVEDSDEDLFDQPEEDITHAITVTPAEQETIDRLEAMGFEKTLVVEAFLACDRNEELAINYLLENAGDYED